MSPNLNELEDGLDGAVVELAGVAEVFAGESAALAGADAELLEFCVAA